MWLGQWPPVQPLALGNLHNSELEGNGNRQWVPPNFHTFDPEAEGIWRKGLGSLACRFPTCFLSDYLLAIPTWISIKLEEIP